MSTRGDRRKKGQHSDVAPAPAPSDEGSETVVAASAEEPLQPEPTVEAAPNTTDPAAEAEPEAEAISSDEVLAAEPSAAGEGASEPATPSSAPSELSTEQQKRVLESLIFVSDRIVTAAQLARAMKTRAAVVRALAAELMEDYRGRGIELVEVAGGYLLRSAPECAAFVREFVAQKPVRLTRAQLETLALVSYRQPITRPEVDDVRGVDSGSAMRVLLERNLIKLLGRKDEPGRPLLYGTTSHFLEFFGMQSLKDLPTLREFTDLSDENRALFKRKTGEDVEGSEALLAAAEEAARLDEEQSGHISDEDLAELAAEADAAEAEDSAELPGLEAAEAEAAQT
jgi:segregation and condensation protein B